MSEKKALTDISGGMRRQYHSRAECTASSLTSNLLWLYTDYTEILPVAYQYEEYDDLEPHKLCKLVGNNNMGTKIQFEDNTRLHVYLMGGLSVVGHLFL